MSRELIEKMARAIRATISTDGAWELHEGQARAVMSLLSDPANITDEAVERFRASINADPVGEDSSFEQERRAIAAAFSESAA